MACQNCSKVRCKLYGIVSGLKTSFNVDYYCGDLGSACRVTRKNRHVVERDFGNDFDTLGAYLKLLARAAKARIFGGDMPTSIND